jgi:hypothetical protein
VAVSHYPGPKDLQTPTRVAIVVAWPLLTWIGLTGYRRYREGRYREAHIALAVYSITGISTPGHFIYGNPRIPAFFYATLFHRRADRLGDPGFVVWSTSRMTVEASTA